jgi:hypothetical protein
MSAVCISTARRVGWCGTAALGLSFAFAAPQPVVADADDQAGPNVVVKPSKAAASKKGAFGDGSRAAIPPVTPETAQQGGGVALDDPVVLCTQPAANCQLADQAGHGEGGIIGATSDAAAGFVVADNFTATENLRILSV